MATLTTSPYRPVVGFTVYDTRQLSSHRIPFKCVESAPGVFGFSFIRGLRPETLKIRLLTGRLSFSKPSGEKIVPAFNRDCIFNSRTFLIAYKTAHSSINNALECKKRQRKTLFKPATARRCNNAVNTAVSSMITHSHCRTVVTK